MPDHDVAIVAVPAGDAARPSMEVIAALATSWPRPILNAPAAIGMLDRDRLYRRLHGIAGLDIPPTARVTRQRLVSLAGGTLALDRLLDDGAFPLIIRPIDSHAGFGLAKVDDCDALAGYLAAREEEQFFISRFVNYANEDGLFRKYRIVIVDGRPYACHMAVGDEWKVWYLNADMAVRAPHRLEEARFMEEFDSGFAVRHAAALADINARLGLDYVAIDCAETTDGALLVFEADNTAIVHDMDPPNVYPYKPPQMKKIFQAVQAMLYRRAAQRSRAVA
jgi:hypothetical protein